MNNTTNEDDAKNDNENNIPNIKRESFVFPLPPWCPKQWFPGFHRHRSRRSIKLPHTYCQTRSLPSRNIDADLAGNQTQIFRSLYRVSIPLSGPNSSIHRTSTSEPVHFLPPLCGIPLFRCTFWIARFHYHRSRSSIKLPHT